jgi:hypothetical protein
MRPHIDRPKLRKSHRRPSALGNIYAEVITILFLSRNDLRLHTEQPMQERGSICSLGNNEKGRPASGTPFFTFRQIKGEKVD